MIGHQENHNKNKALYKYKIGIKTFLTNLFCCFFFNIVSILVCLFDKFFGLYYSVRLFDTGLRVSMFLLLLSNRSSL